MPWISASHACQTNSTRSLAGDEAGRRRSEAEYATPSIATVASRDRMVVWSMRDARSLDGLEPGMFTMFASLRC